MATFFYQGITENGSQVSDVIVASSKGEAISQLMEVGIEVVKITRGIKKRKSDDIGVKIKLNRKDMIAYFIHVAEMSHAGIKILQSLDLLIEMSNSKKLKHTVSIMKDQINAGLNLADAMRYVGCFDEMFCNLIFVAEKSNSIEKVAQMIVDYIKWTANIKRSINKGVIRPMFSLVVILCAMIGMATFMMPKFLETLSQIGNQKIPSYAKNFITFSAFLQANWYMIPVIVFLLFLCFFIPRFFKIIPAVKFIDMCKLKMPIFGTLLLKIEIARLAAFLSILIHAGYKANEAILMAKNVMVNYYVKDAVDKVGVIMSEGETLYNSFKRFKVFPKFFLSMIGIGETVNDIEGTIMNIKESYDKDIDSTVELAIASVKPIITIISAIIVGWMGSAIFGPMYNSLTGMTNSMR
ncbi:type II secretion system F family protein [Candidatus Deianiraea vastatrix]|uniref:PulF/PilC type II secretion/type IV pilus inner membrane protein n=1 Tax=Candidatus Deianiraea vastatrix TaxID=2163644 RepID=A0A5B8XET8_9RICK|nr:type II secretion system F family protein [Candidatus Deianiraea vastatrix]QED23760.1 Putative PulF/PilC type II secretion/type IV pilus inner membrane protein [Candidatus Deianiraea vastatrix]